MLQLHCHLLAVKYTGCARLHRTNLYYSEGICPLREIFGRGEGKVDRVNSILITAAVR